MPKIETQSLTKLPRQLSVIQTRRLGRSGFAFVGCPSLHSWLRILPSRSWCHRVEWCCRRIFVRFAVGWVCALAVSAATTLRNADTPLVPSNALGVDSPLDLSTNQTPEALAKSVCSTCHLFPAPDLLDRTTWRSQTLPRMMIRMGLSPQSVDAHPEATLLKASGRIPTAPLVPVDVFERIEAFYVGNAPELPIPQARRGEIQIGLPGFEVVRAPRRGEPPATTLIHIDPGHRQLYRGDALAKRLESFSATGDYQCGLEVSNAPVVLVARGDDLHVGMIGSFYPSEKREGALVSLRQAAGHLEFDRQILAGLPRTVDIAQGDLNQDGREDFALCAFGNLQGFFSWYEDLGNGQYAEHRLVELSGAVKCAIRDFNGDGLPDLAVLIAQEHESMMLFYNQGKGVFSSQVAFRQHPLFGHTGFEVVDFNGDGRLDFLVTNGDNGEYASPLKRYHGVRAYLDQGNGGYRPSFFYPLNGAFKAVARDFDGDGDLDLAMISFFPDYESSPEEGFVYLQNRGNGRYAAYTFREVIAGRWLTMDTGDLDQDGDLDIVIGSYIRGPGPVPGFLKADWEAKGPSFLILKNTLR